MPTPITAKTTVLKDGSYGIVFGKSAKSVRDYIKKKFVLPPHAKIMLNPLKTAGDKSGGKKAYDLEIYVPFIYRKGD